MEAKQFIIRVAKSNSPQRLFLLVSIPFGLFFLMTIPALQGWDEATHFLRAYQVSERNVVPDRLGPNSWGGKLPINVLQMNDAFLGDLVASAQSGLHRSVHTRAYITYSKVFTPSKERATRNFESSAVYSPVAYLPSAIGIAVARLAHLPLISYIYLGRLCVLLIWLALTYYAIKRIPVGKWAIVALSLLPTTLTHAVSLAPDALIIASAAALVAVFVDYCMSHKILGAKDILIILTLMLILSLSKPTYALFGLLFVFLPIRNFGAIKKYFLINGVLLFSVLLMSGAWFMTVDNIAQNIHQTQRPGININPQAQEKYVLHNPIKYAATLGNRIITNNTNPVYVQITGVITWKGVLLPMWCILLSYINLILAFLFIKEEKDISGLKESSPIAVRYGPPFLMLVIAGAIYTTLYFAFSVVGSTNIEGVAGRYFIPLIPLLIPLFLRAKKQPLITFDKQKLPVAIVLLSIIPLSFASIALVAANYIPDIFK